MISMQDPTLPSLPLSAIATALGFILYLCVVRDLRWQRYDAIHKKYQAKFEAGTLTPVEAQEVVQLVSMYDMPFLAEQALSFANFKTYAIPTISKLLCETRQLASEEHVSRRYADTRILALTWQNCSLSGRSIPTGSSTPTVDPRVSLSIARVNWMHAKYKISNDDFLFTLSLVIFEPVRWTARYGWRELSLLEKHALFVFWSEVGRRMNIKDIPTSMQELQAWSEAYEEAHMIPAQTNHTLSKHTTGELLFPVPRRFGLRQVTEGLTRALLEDRVRIAMMEPEAPTYAAYLVPFLLRLAAWTQKHLLLPRLKPFSVVQIDLPESSPCGPRLVPTKFTSKPWYKPRRQGHWVFIDRLLVMVGWHADVPSAAYKSDGYKIHELGPTRFENDGHEEVFKIAEGLQGCPISDAWKYGKKS
ncbi:hypothetical protein FB45DRAFT_922921 [Roridomyces roridus]|uniref:ER-bound oxygenase mpaB/mpaB'/Rubber oxygenase catalytic domain-containing protein n=1 Tax=Roridomyces roridus TaxID=1738132 RepID=A0AAD7BP79_9AGAR|nr:hypothetical protein FB45DRAFT_922921 [Roridomyces roridus]